jgi:hypothetical protein
LNGGECVILEFLIVPDEEAHNLVSINRRQEEVRGLLVGKAAEIFCDCQALAYSDLDLDVGALVPREIPE